MPAHTEGTLWRPWQSVWVLKIQGCVPRCALPWDFASPGQVCVCLQVHFPVSVPFWICSLASANPPL